MATIFIDDVSVESLNMKHTHLHTMLSAVALSALAALAQANETQEAMCPAQLSVNQTFEVALEANPSTGYQWQIKEQSAALVLLEERYENSPEAKPMMVGVPGTKIWTFKAAEVGQAQLNLVYVRPWQAHEVAKSWTCSVNVVAE